MEAQALPVLRPLRLGELLDQAIRLYRRNFITFLGIIALVYVPLMILQTAASALMTSSMESLTFAGRPEEIFTNYAYWGGLLSSVVLVFFQFVLVQGIATGALTRAVADNYLGQPTSILDAYRGIREAWPSLLGALLVLILLIVPLSIWSVVPCIGWFTGPGMLVFLMAAVSPLIAPVVVIERQNALAAIRRAWELVRRRFWPVLGTVLVLYLFSLLIVNGPSAIVNAILLTVFSSLEDVTSASTLALIAQALVSLVFVLLYYPLQMAAFTLIYFDLRVRTEGFDLALLTLSSAEPQGARLSEVPVPAADARLITGPELGNFAILTLGAIGLYILFFSVIMGAAFFFTSLLVR